MDSSFLRRKDTTKGPPLRILSLDGGGVRGYSMLIILQELMYRSFVETEGKAPNREEIPKPCDYFDLIAGTGTGGLIAIMLGRLRLDIETCMDVYVRMTRRVFETDKTIAGIPYKTTLFKASKLEEAIRECVREHTIYEDEGNDGTAAGGREFQVSSPIGALPQRSGSVRSNSTMGLTSPITARTSMIGAGLQWGNGNASLFDGRENRTKTAVTAVYKGTPKSGSSIFLRSYNSRKEAPPEFNCTIWQAGRATSATGLAFKPIQIGQSVFIDEGAGKYNPSPQVLEEAAVNEWPGRDVGIFVSVGTGKRPGGTNNRQHEWWEGFVGGSMGSFAEARRRLIAKIEGCEDTHQEMLRTTLATRGVPLENYCRLNVEVGVGEFGMNEWDRLADISTSTRRYLGKLDVQNIVYEAAVKIAKIERTKRRLEVHAQEHIRQSHRVDPSKDLPPTPSLSLPRPPHSAELDADDHVVSSPPNHYRHPPSAPQGPHYPYYPTSDEQDKFIVVPETPATRFSLELPYRSSNEYNRFDSSQRTTPSRGSAEEAYNHAVEAPPRPPKTPINDPGRPPTSFRPSRNPILPYPDDDGPPPIVSKLRKPEFSAR